MTIASSKPKPRSNKRQKHEESKNTKIEETKGPKITKISEPLPPPQTSPSPKKKRFFDVDEGMIRKGELESEHLESLIEDSERQFQSQHDQNDPGQFEINPQRMYKTELEQPVDENRKPGLLDNILEENDADEHNFGFDSFNSK